jgi:hypothetical protein
MLASNAGHQAGNQKPSDISILRAMRRHAMLNPMAWLAAMRARAKSEKSSSGQAKAAPAAAMVLSADK